MLGLISIGVMGEGATEPPQLRQVGFDLDGWGPGLGPPRSPVSATPREHIPPAPEIWRDL